MPVAAGACRSAPPRSEARPPPALIASDASRPNALQGVQFGDPAHGAVLVWSRSDREVFVRVSFQSLGKARALSEPVLGRFITPQADRDDDGWHPGLTTCVSSGAAILPARARGSTRPSAA